MYRRMNFGPSLYLTFAEMLMQGLLVLRYEGNSDYNYLVKDQKLNTGSGCLSKIHRHIDQSGAGTRYCLRPASSTTSSLPSKKKTSNLDRSYAPTATVPKVGQPSIDRGLGAAQTSGRAILIRFIDAVVLP